MTLSPERSILLIVDMQERLMPVIAESNTVIGNAVRLAETARLLGIPILATEQNPQGLGPTVSDVRVFAPTSFSKFFFDATREPTWPAELPGGRNDVVIAGCEAHVCVLQTAMGLLKDGRAVYFVRDSVGSRTPANREAACQRAERHGAELVTTEMVIFEWLRSSNHAQFREVLRFIK